MQANKYLPALFIASAMAATQAIAADAAPAVSDAEAKQLAQKSNCFTCHAIDKKQVGPAWKAVADKYRGDPNAEAKLVAKVSKGGAGSWGSVPMPPFAPKVKDADIRTLVKYILSLK